MVIYYVMVQAEHNFRVTSPKLKPDKLDLIKIKYFCTSKDPIKKVKRERAEREVFVPRLEHTKNCYGFIRQNPDKKWAKDLHRHFSKDDTHTANKQMKGPLHRWVLGKRNIITSSDYAWRRWCPRAAGGSVKWCNHCGKLAVPKTWLPCDPACPLPGTRSHGATHERSRLHCSNCPVGLFFADSFATLALEVGHLLLWNEPPPAEQPARTLSLFHGAGSRARPWPRGPE